MADLRGSAAEFDVVLFSSLLREPVNWLLPGRIPLGKVTVIGGESGLGKSLLGQVEISAPNGMCFSGGVGIQTT